MNEATLLYIFLQKHNELYLFSDQHNPTSIWTDRNIPRVHEEADGVSVAS